MTVNLPPKSNSMQIFKTVLIYYLQKWYYLSKYSEEKFYTQTLDKIPIS